MNSVTNQQAWMITCLVLFCTGHWIGGLIAAIPCSLYTFGPRQEG